MPGPVLSSSGDLSLGQNSSLTRFYPLGGGAFASARTAAADVEFTVRTACIYSHMYMNVAVNNIPNASTAAIISGGGVKNNNLSIPGNTTGEFTDLTDTDRVTAGVTANCFRIVTGSGGGTLSAIAVSFLCETIGVGGTLLTRLTSAGPITISGINSYCLPISGRIDLGSRIDPTSEANIQYKARCGGTLSNLGVRVNANTRTDNCTFSTRINAGTGTVSVSITATTTGLFEDTTHSDTINPGDLINLRIAVGVDNTNSLSISMIVIEFKNDSGTGFFTSCDTGVPLVFPTSGLALYYYVQGDLQGVLDSETQVQIRSATPVVKASNLGIAVNANSNNGTAVLKLRQNGTDGALSVTVGAGLTGYFEDLSNSMNLWPEDLIDYAITNNSSSGTCSIGVIGHQFQLVGENFRTTVLRPRIPAPGLAR